MFTAHTIESAPPASRRLMTATQSHLGYLPAATARWAASPQLLDGFGKLTALFDATTLGPGGARGPHHDRRHPQRLPPVRRDAHRAAHQRWRPAPR